MPVKELSRQRKWQLKQMELGRCILCGKKATATGCYCRHHLALHRGWARDRRARLRKLKGAARPGGTTTNRKEASVATKKVPYQEAKARAATKREAIKAQVGNMGVLGEMKRQAKKK